MFFEIMFLILKNRKNKRLYKRFCTALNLNQSNQNHLKSFLFYLQDIKNNPNFEAWYMRYASNNSAIQRGCSLNLIRQGHRFS